MPHDDELVRKRVSMVRDQIAARGITDKIVLEAMRIVPREMFVPENMRDFAYRDSPMPIGCGQTISQPLIVAMMIEAARVRPGARVLDVGTGSGYAAAVLGQIAGHVFSIERHRELAQQAASVIKGLGYGNIEITVGDGSRGWPDEAPFGGIIVAAGGPEPPPALLEQLAHGGRLVMPVGTAEQQLVRITRTANGFIREELGAVAFVPLVGAQGWAEPDATQ